MSKPKWIVVVAMLAVVAAAGGCGGSLQAPRAPDGGPVGIDLLVDLALEGKDPDRQNQLQQIGDFMEPDITNRLRDTGYEVTAVGAAAEYVPAPGRYLLKIVVVDYNPGSKAARMLVGFGAGSASLDIHYELVGEAPTPIVSRDDGRASSKDWTNVIRRLDKDIVIHITDVLNGAQ